MKIGIFGGTFDPFTEAHEAIVKKVLDEKLVDKVFIVPTVVDYYRNKDDKWLTNIERISVIKDRVYKMKREGYCVNQSTREIDELQWYASDLQDAFVKGRRFYHTLVRIMHRVEVNESHDNEYYTIIGTDQYRNFKNWFMWEEILKLSKLIVVDGRNGDILGETVGYLDRVPYQNVQIDKKYEKVSASEIRREYKGTKDAVDRYINRLPPIREKLLQHTPIFDLVEKREVDAGFCPVGINAPDWVTVVAAHKDCFLMVRQDRYGTMKNYTEFVCGQVDKDETPMAAAFRELEEETGVRLDRPLTYLGSYDTNPAFMNNRMHFYFVELTDEEVKKMGDQKLDEHEKIELVWRDRADPEWKDAGPAFRALAVRLANEQKKKGE